MPLWSSPPAEVKTVLVTGGAGFIGSAFLNLLVPRFPEIRFVNVDALTYAGHLASLKEVDQASNYSFAHLNLVDRQAVEALVLREKPQRIYHFAAETHVDRSIKDPVTAVHTNVLGTLNLLEAVRKLDGFDLFHHVSTDEVFGSLGKEGAFNETTSYDPSSPYSSGKAASDHLVRAYFRTYGLPSVITNCSNNYGPRQYPEKLMPVMILAAAEGRPLPVYGDGSNIRDWLYVDDHINAIWEVGNRGSRGETYCIGGKNERTNLEIVQSISKAVAKHLNRPEAEILSQIKFVDDRPGHDWRYAIDPTKIETELGWFPEETMETGIEKTVAWYLSSHDWLKSVRTEEYKAWMDDHYAQAGQQQ